MFLTCGILVLIDKDWYFVFVSFSVIAFVFSTIIGIGYMAIRRVYKSLKILKKMELKELYSVLLVAIVVLYVINVLVILIV